MFACGGGRFRVAKFYEKLAHLPLKSESSLQRRLSLRNSENVMAFFCVVNERTNAANSFESLLVCRVRWQIKRYTVD